MAYYFDFASYGGAAYRVEIGGVGGTKIEGAPDPFVTGEDDSTDFFTPVRSQTGTLRVIDTDGSLMESLIPQSNTSTSVVLREMWNIGSNVIWRGFLGTDVYTQPWDNNTYILEFRVISMTEALKYATLDTSLLNQSVSVLSIINHAFSRLSLAPTIRTIDHMHEEWLYMHVDCAVFFREKTVCNQGVREVVAEGVSCYSVMESICKFFGLTMRESGEEVYFAVYDRGPAFNTVAINTLTFLSTGNTKSFVQGGRRAAVILKLDKRTMNIALPQTEETADTPYDVEVNEGKHVYVQPHPNRTNGQETFTYLEYDKYTLVGTSNYNGMLQHSVIAGYAMNPYYYNERHLFTGAYPVRWFYRREDSDVPRLTNGLYLQTQYPYSGQGSRIDNLCYSIKSTEPFWTSNGYLNITFRLHSFGFDSDNGHRWFTDTGYTSIGTEMNVAIRIGDYFWNQGAQRWQQGSNPLDFSFAIQFDNEKLVSNKTIEMLVDATEGFFIHCNSMYGEVELYIINFTYTYPTGDKLRYKYVYAHIIDDLQVTFYELNSMTASDRDSNEYRETIAISGFEEDKEINIEIGTMNNNVSCRNFVRQNDGLSYLYRITYYTGTGHYSQRPEMNLLSRMVDYYSQIRRNMRCVIEQGEDLIYKLFSDGGHLFLGIDAKHNWRDDSQEVEFIEVS